MNEEIKENLNEINENEKNVLNESIKIINEIVQYVNDDLIPDELNLEYKDIEENDEDNVKDMFLEVLDDKFMYDSDINQYIEENGLEYEDIYNFDVCIDKHNTIAKLKEKLAFIHRENEMYNEFKDEDYNNIHELFNKIKDYKENENYNAIDEIYKMRLLEYCYIVNYYNNNKSINYSIIYDITEFFNNMEIDDENVLNNFLYNMENLKNIIDANIEKNKNLNEENIKLLKYIYKSLNNKINEIQQLETEE